jgi:hypothetical protein
MMDNNSNEEVVAEKDRVTKEHTIFLIDILLYNMYSDSFRSHYADVAFRRMMAGFLSMCRSDGVLTYDKTLNEQISSIIGKVQNIAKKLLPDQWTENGPKGKGKGMEWKTHFVYMPVVGTYCLRCILENHQELTRGLKQHRNDKRKSLGYLLDYILRILYNLKKKLMEGCVGVSSKSEQYGIELTRRLVVTNAIFLNKLNSNTMMDLNQRMKYMYYHPLTNDLFERMGKNQKINPLNLCFTTMSMFLGMKGRHVSCEIFADVVLEIICTYVPNISPDERLRIISSTKETNIKPELIKTEFADDDDFKDFVKRMQTSTNGQRPQKRVVSFETADDELTEGYDYLWLFRESPITEEKDEENIKTAVPLPRQSFPTNSSQRNPEISYRERAAATSDEKKEGRNSAAVVGLPNPNPNTLPPISETPTKKVPSSIDDYAPNGEKPPTTLDPKEIPYHLRNTVTGFGDKIKENDKRSQDIRDERDSLEKYVENKLVDIEKEKMVYLEFLRKRREEKYGTTLKEGGICSPCIGGTVVPPSPCTDASSSNSSSSKLHQNDNDNDESEPDRDTPYTMMVEDEIDSTRDIGGKGFM